ncbi:MAG: HAD hydrolase family protein [Anaerolineales bacterium]|nr:HAD hydrolase family protein [Anaerolineales bacterium]
MAITSSLHPTCPEQRFLLASDIDGTLLGDACGTALLRALGQAHRKSFILAYMTGRYISSVLTDIKAGILLRPDYICANVGTEIVDLNDLVNTTGRRYAQRVSNHWDLEEVYRLGVGEGVWVQDFPEGQPPYQAGFLWDGRAESLAAFEQRLAGHDRWRILASYSHYIDVFPGRLGKGEAVRFLQQELGLDPGQVVVAGDAGNDLEMFQLGFKGIVPVNALDELKTAAREPWHYHSSLPAGRAVLDGLIHFGFLDGNLPAE